ncbi:MAG: hypothetical protein HRT86_14960 [Ilumatobacteraceae bacterium]|nr:hypothetical protein [Ilumatobacteraceae bacterium]
MAKPMTAKRFEQINGAMNMLHDEGVPPKIAAAMMHEALHVTPEEADQMIELLAAKGE